MEPQQLTSEVLLTVITSMEPIGKFYTIGKGRIVAVDTTTGEAWTEEFAVNELQEALDWLNRIEPETTSEPETHAIDFANWLLTHDYIPADAKYWRKRGTDNFFTSLQLFRKFKK